MWLFVGAVRRRFREGLDDRTGYWVRLGAVTGIVAIAFQEIVEFSLQMPVHTETGLAAGLAPSLRRDWGNCICTR